MKRIKEAPKAIVTDPKERPFTHTSDMLILQLLVEDKATAAEIAVMLGRSIKSVTERIQFLKESGKLRKLHRELMHHKGIYAMKCLRKKINCEVV